MRWWWWSRLRLRLLRWSSPGGGRGRRGRRGCRGRRGHRVRLSLHLHIVYKFTFSFNKSSMPCVRRKESRWMPARMMVHA